MLKMAEKVISEIEGLKRDDNVHSGIEINLPPNHFDKGRNSELLEIESNLSTDKGQSNSELGNNLIGKELVLLHILSIIPVTLLRRL